MRCTELLYVSFSAHTKYLLSCRITGIMQGMKTHKKIQFKKDN